MGRVLLTRPEIIAFFWLRMDVRVEGVGLDGSGVGGLARGRALGPDLG